MVNMIIYLKKEYNPKELVKDFLEEKLIASATIDEYNISYEMNDNGFLEQLFNVITSQSKALLFYEVISFVEKEYVHEIPINSTPIVSSNEFFNIKLKTKNNSDIKL